MQAEGPDRKLEKRAWVLPAKPQRMRNSTSEGSANTSAGRR